MYMYILRGYAYGYYRRATSPLVLFRQLNVHFLLFRILIVVLLLLLTIRTVFKA